MGQLWQRMTDLRSNPKIGHMHVMVIRNRSGAGRATWWAAWKNRSDACQSNMLVNFKIMRLTKWVYDLTEVCRVP